MTLQTFFQNWSWRIRTKNQCPRSSRCARRGINQYLKNENFPKINTLNQMCKKTKHTHKYLTCELNILWFLAEVFWCCSHLLAPAKGFEAWPERRYKCVDRGTPFSKRKNKFDCNASMSGGYLVQRKKKRVAGAPTHSKILDYLGSLVVRCLQVLWSGRLEYAGKHFDLLGSRGHARDLSLEPRVRY